MQRHRPAKRCRPSSAPSVVTLSAQDAAAAGVTAASSMVWNQLNTTPVIPLGGGSNATVSFALRGPDPTETLVDIDGHAVNNGNTGDYDLSLLDPAAAAKRPARVRNRRRRRWSVPNTLGGAINVQTLQPTLAPHALLRLFGGSVRKFRRDCPGDRFGWPLRIRHVVSRCNVERLGEPDGCSRPRRAPLRRTRARDVAVGSAIPSGTRC